MGCIGSSNRNLQQPTFSAILSEIFELVPREEMLKQFNKRSEIIKYYIEFDWAKISPQFRLEVKTLTDHIESNKIRLNDTALYVENKIKLSQNPIIIKMCMLILLELVQNLHKFTQTKEIPVINLNNEESRLDVSQRSIQMEHLQTLTQVSDNFLKFELAFSNLLSQLINDKMIYATVWWEYLLQTLELFSKKSTKQFQSENIQSILTFLEYIIGVKLGYQDQLYLSSQFSEWVVKTNEQQLAIQDLLDSIKEPYGIVVVYKDTLQMMPMERLFLTKNQKQLFGVLLADHKKFTEQPAWHKLIEVFLSRALNQQLYEELFQILFNNFDEETWKNSHDILDIIYIVLEVAKEINQLSNTEIFIFTKLIDYLDTPIDRASLLESPGGPALSKKPSESKMYHVNGNVKCQIIKLLIDLFNNIESNQFILFYQTQTIKVLLQHLRLNTESDAVQDIKLCLIALLRQIASDQNSVQLFINQILSFAYSYSMNILNNTAINSGTLVNVLLILHESIKKTEDFNSTIIITEEMILMLIEIAEVSNNIQQLCAQVLASLFIHSGKLHSNDNINEVNSYLIANSNIIGLSAYFLFNSALISSTDIMVPLMNKFFDFIPVRLSSQQIISLIANIIDDNIKQGSQKLSKSNRKINFDQLKNKEIRFCMIIKLISVLDDEISKSFSQILYGLLGPQFQLYKRQGFGALQNQIIILSQDIQTLLSTNNINQEVQQILSLCLDQTPIDFEKIRKQFKENLSNNNNQNVLINLDDIHVKEDLERGSIMNQSFQAPSHIEVQLDESFEKQLQTIKKQKIKQDKLEHLTTEQKEMVEY